jgi:hypothetical protein
MTQTETSKTPVTGVLRRAVSGRRRPAWDDLKVLLWFLGWVVGVETVALIIWAIAIWVTQGWSSAFAVLGVAMICSGAASLVGGLLGFLFGIPRSTESSVNRTRLTHANGTPPEAVTSDAAAAPASPAPAAPSTAETHPQLRVNTNLEDISDGITKVLLGAGLAQATQIVAGAGQLAGFLGPSFGPGAAGQAVALATIIYGLLEGFFAGYLATRLYLTAAFERADPH